ncbi:CIA1 [Sanghuangporus sanghuang]
MTKHPYRLSQIAELTGHEDRVWCIAWNPVRPLLASCSGDKSVRVYHYKKSYRVDMDSSPSQIDDDDENVKFELQASVQTGHAKTVRCVAWAPSGKTFATASFDSNIAVWEQEGAGADGDDDGGMDVDGELSGNGGSGEWECASLLEGHETECKSVAYSSTGTLLASCSRDKTVWVWEVQPDSDFECMGVLMAHTQDVKCVAWHPNEEILASGSYDDTIKLYVDDPDDDWYDFATLTGHTSTVWSLAFSPCGEYLASASDDRTVKIWRRVKGERWKWEEAFVLSGTGVHERSVYSVSWSKGLMKGTGNGEEESKGWLASAGGDGRINVWDIQKRADNSIHASLITMVENAHGVCDVNCISWCPREGFEDLLASAGDDWSRIECTATTGTAEDLQPDVVVRGTFDILKTTKAMAPPSTFERFVEVGRVILLNSGESKGKIAVIVEIIDHNRAIIDNPLAGVPRQAFRYRHMILTPLTVPKLPRSAGSGVVKKRLEAGKTLEKWSNSPWAKRVHAVKKRRALNDFGRFKVMVHKKQLRYKANVDLAKAKKA